jgi:type IV pilus assembly protein PilN
MMRINLLPYREHARQERQKRFVKITVTAWVTGIIIAAMVMMVVDYLRLQQEQFNQNLALSNQKLQSQVKDMGQLKKDIKGLEARQKAVLALQSRRNDAVVLLNDLSRLTPSGLYLTAIQDKGDWVQIQGVTTSNDKISELLRQLEQAASSLRAPELLEIKASPRTPLNTDGGGALAPAVRSRLLEFTLVAHSTFPMRASAAKAIKQGL